MENVYGIEKIFKEDVNFTNANLLPNGPRLNYPVNSNFLNGCIRLSKKNDAS
jgi:hypothetical protein